MTKQEIRDLVATKIAGQGTQVDLGNALPTIIDAIVDLLPDAPVVIDLSEFELSAECTDVTSAIPVGWKPKYNDVVRYSGDLKGFRSCTADIRGDYNAQFGNISISGDSESTLEIISDIDGGLIYARLYDL